MENHKKKASYKARYCVFLALAIVIVSQFNLVFAFTFDNVKTYDQATKEVSIYNAYKLPVIGDEIIKLKRTTPNPNPVIRSNSKSFEDRRPVVCYEIKNYNSKYTYTDLFTNQEFYNLKKGGISEATKINRDYDWRIKVKTPYQAPTYKQVCNKGISKAGAYTSCDSVKNGTETKYRISYTPLTDIKAVMNNQEVCLFTYVAPGDHGEQIPEFAGVKIFEDSEWTDNLSTGLKMYYNFDQNSGDITEMLLGEYNATWTATENWGTGILGYSQDVDANANYLSDITDNDQWEIATNGDFTLNFWINWDNGTNNQWLLYASKPGVNCGWIIGNQDDGNSLYFGAEQLTWDDVISGVGLGGWNMVTFVYDEATTNLSGYINGSISLSVTRNLDIDNCVYNKRIGANEVGGTPYNGEIDELGKWNRTLTASEITQLYNSGIGITYSASGGDGDTVPVPTLESPTDSYNISTQNIEFNYSCVDDNSVENVTLYIDDAVNTTTTWGTSNTTGTISTSLTLAEGSHTWNVSCDDNNNPSSTNTSNARNIIIDLTNPSITINTPTDGEVFITNTTLYNISSNVTISDDHLDTCIFFNGTANNTITCGNNASVELGEGYHTLGWYANDTMGNFNYTENTIFINYYYHNATYTDPAIKAETYDFNLTVTATDIGEFNGTFYYNGTIQNTTYSDNGTVGYLGSNVATNATGNVGFNWIYYINGTMVNASYSHTVNDIEGLSVVSGTSCGAGLSPALYYNFSDEQNNTQLNATADYIFRYGISDPNQETISGSITTTDFTVCINSTIWSNFSIGYGEIQYQPTGYSDRRHYLFSNQQLSNTTISNTLYSLTSETSTSFLFTIEKGDLSVFDGVYLTLNRWYPEEDTYKIVEMSRTDDEGQTVMKVAVEDVDYRVGVYYTNGTLVYLAAPFRLVCIATPCSYTLIVPEDAGSSLENWNNLDVSLEYNETTHIFTMIYNDPSQDTDTITLDVYRDSGISELLICSDNASSYTGVLTCNVTGYSGLLRAVGYRTASPETAIISKIINQGVTKLGKTPALFITILAMIFLVSVGIVSPILTVILSVIGFIPALIFGIMPLPILLIIAAMGFIVIHFAKRSVAS